MRTRFHSLLACLALALPLAVTAGAQAATIPPGLVVANETGNTLTSYPLSATGDADPAATVSGSVDEPTGVAVDAAGDAWATNYENSTVVEYSKAGLAAGGAPTPVVTLTSDADDSLDRPTGLAFDPAGDLWVANLGSNTLVEYTASQLASGGAQTPAVTLTSDGSNSIDSPYFIAFDAAGDLWVPDYGASTLVEFTPAELAASGDPTPAATISPDSSGSLAGLTSVSFDPAGDLWTATSYNETLLEYAPSQLTTGTPSPVNKLSGSEFSDPADAAFDSAGDLWVTNLFGGSVDEFDPAQLAAGGSPTPVNIIEGSDTGLSGPEGLAVDQGPTVSSISADRGPGGTKVTIYGTGFYSGSAVEFGAKPATSITYMNPYQLTAVAPAGSGTVDVTVTDGQGISATSPADRFTYAATSSITPTLVVGNDLSNTLASFPLSASGDVTPSATLSDRSGELETPVDGALDAAGDLWVPSDNEVQEYTQRQLVDGGPQTPAATITSDSAGSLNDPDGAAFDPAGNLWVVNFEGNSVVEYTKAQLASGGTLVPAVTLMADSSNSLNEPAGLDFDAAGDLWVSNFEGNTAVEYTKAQLASSGAPTPAVTLSADASNSLATPDALTFDRHGDLWVTNGFEGNTVVEYTPGQLVTGAPTPAVTISSDGSGSLNGSDQAQFDAAGDLWVANFDPSGEAGSIVEFTPAQLASSGSPTPVDTIGGGASGLANPWLLVIEQAPTVSTVSPADGPAAGGSTVTISGTGFYPGSTVDFGDTPATSVTYLSPYELTAVAPAGSGAVDVTVTTGEGTSDTSSADQFAYAASSVTPTSTTSGTAPVTVPVLVPRIQSSSHQLKVNGHLAGLTLTCSVVSCQGTIRLSQRVVVTVRHGSKKVRRVETVVLANAHYRLRAGQRAVVELRLSGATVAELEHARQRRLSAGLSVTVTGGKTLNASVALIATRHR